MKILFIVPYITTERHHEFQRNKTGFGLMVYDIAKSVGVSNDVELFAVNTIAPSLEMENFRTVKKCWSDLIKSFSFRSLRDAFVFQKKYKLPAKERLRVIYQFLSIAQIEKKMSDFDIIHIHGCSPITDATIRACKRQNKPFLVTLHGLVSFQNEVRLHESLKQYEKDFLVEAYRNDYNVSFISTGNLETALAYVQSQFAMKS